MEAIDERHAGDAGASSFCHRFELEYEIHWRLLPICGRRIYVAQPLARLVSFPSVLQGCGSGFGVMPVCASIASKTLFAWAESESSTCCLSSARTDPGDLVYSFSNLVDTASD